MHWITHRQRPSEWEPTALATIALQSTRIPDHDVTYSPPRPTRVKESQPMPSLRRGKATPREVSPGERRPFASGGPGWRQRGLPANCSYDDVKRPSTTGAIMVASKPMDGRPLVVTPGVMRDKQRRRTYFRSCRSLRKTITGPLCRRRCITASSSGVQPLQRFGRLGQVS